VERISVPLQSGVNFNEEGANLSRRFMDWQHEMSFSLTANGLATGGNGLAALVSHRTATSVSECQVSKIAKAAF
jgi:hypothetical protein